MAVRETVATLGLGVLGGLWAVAWGTKRVDRPSRVAMLDARTRMQVHLDALRSRTAQVARLTEAAPAASRLLDEVVEQEILIASILARAANPTDVDELDTEVDDAFQRLEEAGELVGLSLPADDRFAGLCGMDPEHGVAVADHTDGRVCARCAESGAAGHELRRRQITRGGRPVPFDT